MLMNGGTPAMRALLDPRRRVLGREAAPAVLLGPVDAGEAGVEEPPLPRGSFVAQIGRQDGAVVPRRVRLVRRQPRGRLVPERLDVDHPPSSGELRVAVVAMATTAHQHSGKA